MQFTANTATQTPYAATTSSTVALVANANRNGLRIQNQGSNPVYVGFGKTATADDSCYLIPAGVTDRWHGSETPSDSVNVITTGGSTALQLLVT